MTKAEERSKVEDIFQTKTECKRSIKDAPTIYEFELGTYKIKMPKTAFVNIKNICLNPSQSLDEVFVLLRGTLDLIVDTQLIDFMKDSSKDTECGTLFNTIERGKEIPYKDGTSFKFTLSNKSNINKCNVLVSRDDIKCLEFTYDMSNGTLSEIYYDIKLFLVKREDTK